MCEILTGVYFKIKILLIIKIFKYCKKKNKKHRLFIYFEHLEARNQVCTHLYYVFISMLYNNIIFGVDIYIIFYKPLDVWCVNHGKPKNEN